LCMAGSSERRRRRRRSRHPPSVTVRLRPGTSLPHQTRLGNLDPKAEGV
jgi:hypothetical protein